MAKRMIEGIERQEVQKLRNADRHLRRSALQLSKAVKGMDS